MDPEVHQTRWPPIVSEQPAKDCGFEALLFSSIPPEVRLMFLFSTIRPPITSAAQQIRPAPHMQLRISTFALPAITTASTSVRAADACKAAH